ncbi:hypothetical protein KBC75_01540 [Candidatus Shapirobacteria bacterium]|nr:hypothetical protein [Candidatus Shapirobacteria bacterium]
MNEFNQNSRTLIVSFVVAIMVLIPLRFVEAGQSVVVSTPVVLGETVTNQQVELPALEAPYAEIENGVYKSCLTIDEANIKVSQLEGRLNSGDLTEQQTYDILSQVAGVQMEVCKN